MKLTLDEYRKLTNSIFIDKYSNWLNIYSEQFNLNTTKRILCFFSNLIVETGNFKYVEEIASGIKYEGRIDLGNTNKGDGVKFKGRGLGMITGKRNYQFFTNFCNSIGININFVVSPQKIDEPQFAVLSAFWFWKTNNLESYADRNEFQKVCSIWNTGKPNTQNNRINGWNDRVLAYNMLSKNLTTILNGK
jgi:putative chitinase